MNDFDPKLLETLKKLGDLAAIEARLVRQETKARITLILGLFLAVFAFAVVLGCVFNPAWLPLDR